MKFFLYGLLLLSLAIAIVRSSDQGGDDSTQGSQNCSGTYNDTGHEDEFELIKIFVYCRHGARNPYFIWPKDTSNKTDTWPGTLGVLTAEGRNTSLQVGMWIGNYYSTLLQDACGYNEPHIMPAASPYLRTMETAYYILKGICPTRDIPIPVRTASRYKDNMMCKFAPCPARDEIILAYYNDKPKQDVINTNNDTINHCLGDVFGVNMSNFANNWDLIKTLEACRDTCYIKNISNITQSKEEDDCCEAIYNILKKLLYNDTGNNYTASDSSNSSDSDTLKKVNEVAITNVLFDFMDSNPRIYPADSATPPTKIKLILIVGHDPYVASFLKILGADDERKNISTNVLPAYNFCIVVGLYARKSDGALYITIMIKRPGDDTPTTVRMDPCCNAIWCPLELLRRALKPILEANYDELCGNSCASVIYPCFA